MKIAIVELDKKSYSRDDDDYIEKAIGSKITDWEDVSDQDYQMLANEFQHSDRFFLVRKDINQKETIKQTVQDHLLRIKKIEQDRLKAEEIKLAAQSKRQKAMLEKKKAKELAMLQELQAKYKTEKS